MYSVVIFDNQQQLTIKSNAGMIGWSVNLHGNAMSGDSPR